MSTLRVLLDAPPTPGRADAWTLFDDGDRILRSGRSDPASWPASARREAVLAASALRLVALRLPPLTADRVAAAATFALEDQLAGPARDHHIAVSAQRRDGMVEAVIATRVDIVALAAQFERVVAEPALAPVPASGRWRWYASGVAGGFVRTPDGAAFATGDIAALPAELTLALDHAARSGAKPAHVEAAFKADDATLAAWSRTCGTTFERSDLWRWQDAGRAAFADATNLLQGELARGVPAQRTGGRRPFRIALAIAVAAIALQVVATLSEWTWLRVEQWRTARAVQAIARDAGVPEGEAPAAGLARRHADARHRAGLAAPADALPMLARAAPALAQLPPGTLKSATYGDGHWTFDLAKTDASAASAFEQRLDAAGLATLQATTAAGTRVRVTLGADAR
jgi:type II secretion system protein L